MKVTTTFERLMPTTADGQIIKVTTYYSSWDKSEIDKLQEDLRNTIGSGVVTEFVPNNMQVISQKSINKMWKGEDNGERNAN